MPAIAPTMMDKAQEMPPPDVDMSQVPQQPAPEAVTAIAPPMMPQKGFTGKEAHTSQMKDFDDRLTNNRFQTAKLDVHDPQYVNKLQALHTEGASIRGEKARYESEHPWGSPESAHPGVLGKIAHGLSTAGQIAGQTVAPQIMDEIPGTKANLNKQIETSENEIANTAKQHLQGAQAEQAEAEAELAPSKAAKNTAQAGQAEATAGKTDVQTDLLKNPNPETHFEQLQDGSVVGLTTDVHTGNTSAKLLYKGDPKRQTQIATLMVNGKPHSVLTDKITGETIKDLGETKSPGEGSAASNLVVLPGGEVKKVEPGMVLPEGTQNIAGYANLGRPTQSTRTMGEMAKTVLNETPRIKDEVDRLADKIGPGAGRWNDFWVNKGGIDDPDFAALDTDLDLYASALVRTHFGARGGQEYRKELHKRFGEAQSPEDLKSRIDGATNWIEGYAKAGEPRGRTEKPAVGGVKPTPPLGATHTGRSKSDHKLYYLDAQGKKLGPAE